jgi:hypothetical protein
LACSETGRVAARLGCRLLLQEAFGGAVRAEGWGHASVRDGFVMDVLHSLPSYLVHWRGDFISESCVCVSALQALVRRGSFLDNQESNSDASRSSLSRLAILLEPIVTVNTTMTTRKVSILEQYPEELQRQVVGLLTMLSTMAVPTVKGLSDICARCRTRDKATKLCTVSKPVASLITQCIHELRKSIPMPVFVSFLIDGTGVMSLDKNLDLDDLTSYSIAIDGGVRDASSCLVQCGTHKILPMLETLLAALLETSHDNANQCRMIQVRVALSFLAIFSWDLAQNGPAQSSIFALVSNDFYFLVCDQISWMLTTCTPAKGLESSGALHRWIQPVISLFASERTIMSQVFSTMVSRLADSNEASLHPSSEAWIAMVKSSAFDLPQQEDCASMISAIKSLQQMANGDGQMDLSIGRLLAELELKSERNGWSKIAASVS